MSCPSLESFAVSLHTSAFQDFTEGGFGLVRHGSELTSSLEISFQFWTSYLVNNLLRAVT